MIGLTKAQLALVFPFDNRYEGTSKALSLCNYCYNGLEFEFHSGQTNRIVPIVYLPVNKDCTIRSIIGLLTLQCTTVQPEIGNQSLLENVPTIIKNVTS